jgi:hypothetical protein
MGQQAIPFRQRYVRDSYLLLYFPADRKVIDGMMFEVSFAYPFALDIELKWSPSVGY